MSANSYFVDSASRRSVFIQRYASGLDKAGRESMASLFDEAASIIDNYNDLASLSPREIQELKSRINNLFITRIGESSEKITKQLVDFAINEAEFSAEMFGNAVGGAIDTPTPNELRASVYNSRFGFSGNINIVTAFDRFGAYKASQAVRAITDGVSEGLTSQKISNIIRGLLPLTRSQSGSIIRTGVNQVSTIARMKMLEANRKLFDGYEWVSTLDSRTSLICMGRDGIIYKFKPSSPLPPAHWGCRSTVIPKIKDKFNLLKDVDGSRPSMGADGVEQVSARTTYSGWLRRQPASFQDEVLGKTRGKLFRSGKLSLTRFVDESGQTYDLDALRSLNPLAFERANLN